jgi:hypothetical protein
MKNKLIAFAGVVAVLLAFAKIYEKPLLAQVRAALTQDSDAPGRHVFGFQDFGGSPFFIVPADRRYIIDQYSGECSTTGSMTEVAIDTIAGGTPVEFATGSAHFYATVGGVPVQSGYRATGVGPIYADPGTTVQLRAAGTGLTSNFCDYFVTGHYVLVP